MKLKVAGTVSVGTPYKTRSELDLTRIRTEFRRLAPSFFYFERDEHRKKCSGRF